MQEYSCTHGSSFASCWKSQHGMLAVFVQKRAQGFAPDLSAVRRCIVWGHCVSSQDCLGQAALEALRSQGLSRVI